MLLVKSSHENTFENQILKIPLYKIKIKLQNRNLVEN